MGPTIEVLSLCENIPPKLVLRGHEWPSEDIAVKPIKETNYIYKSMVIPGLYRRADEKFHRQCAQALGPKFNKRLYQLAFKHAVAVHDPVVWSFLDAQGRAWRNKNVQSILKAYQVRQYIQEAVDDGCPQIIPALVLTGQSAQEARKTLGKATWRKLHKCSISRARNILRAGITSDYPIEEELEWLLEVRSTILPWLNLRTDTEKVVAKLAPKVGFEEVHNTRNIVQDTRRMLGNRFNPDWSLNRMREEHDKETARINRLQYSDEPFCEKLVYEAGGYRAELLTSAFEYHQEGATMRHCVASYWRDAARGDYRTFKIEGPERATVGLYLGLKSSQREVWKVNQVYTYCNRHVNLETRSFADKVADWMNEVLLETYLKERVRA